jgi:hypothetical protein
MTSELLPTEYRSPAAAGIIGKQKYRSLGGNHWKNLVKKDKGLYDKLYHRRLQMGVQ